MRELRFVTVGDDGAHVVVETSDGGEQFRLPLDSTLREAARTDRTATAAHQQPTITPREIQTRVRAGESPAELADANGMTLERLLRFAQPVLDERARIADEARRARARRSTTEGQLVVFGEAVDARFAKHGIDPTQVRWDSRRREDGQWVVSAHWLGGDSEWSAEWLFHLAARNLTPLDDTAADLLSDRPIRPVAPPGDIPRPGLSIVVAPEPVEYAAVDDVFDQEALDDDEGLSHPRHAFSEGFSTPGPTGPTSVPAPGDFRPPTPLPPAGQLVTGDFGVQAGPGQVATATVDGEQDGDESDRLLGSGEHLVYEPPAYESPVRYELQLGDEGPISYDAPPLPLRLADADLADPTADEASKHTNRLPRVTNLGTAPREESDEEKAARARIPSWDDILMGVRRKHD